MKTGWFLLSIATALLISATISSKNYKPIFQLTEEKWKLLKEGKVIISEQIYADKEGAKKLRFIASALIKASPEQVWAVLRGYDLFEEFMPRVKECQVVKWRKDGCAVVRYDSQVLWVQVHYYILSCPAYPFRKIEFKLAQGYDNQIKDTYGFWEIIPAPKNKGSILSYSAYLDSGFPVPEFIAKRLTRSSLIEVLKNVKKRVESGGKWKKSSKD